MSPRARLLSRGISLVVVALLGVAFAGGVMLVAFYVPSVKDAWSSVVYLEDSVPGGRLLRGMHGWASHGLVLAVCIQAVVAALTGGYAPPYGRLYGLRLARAGVVLGLAITGHALPWDQPGFWARRVELSLTALVPGAGPWLAALVQGGGDLGQLALSRLYASHGTWLPLVLVALLWLEKREVRRIEGAPGPPAEPWWRDASWSERAATAIFVLSVVWTLLLVAARARLPLGAPADPASAYVARPEWFLLPLYRLRAFFHGPTAEVLGTTGGLVVLLGFFAALPRLDAEGRRRDFVRAGTVLLVGAFVGLGLAAARTDFRDPRFRAERRRDDARAQRARELARAGLPPEGPLAALRRDPLLRGEDVFASRCASCHVLGDLGELREAKAPVLDGWGTERWIRGLLHAPDDPKYFGRSPYRERMPSVDVPPEKVEPDAPPFKPMPEEDQVAVAAFLAALGDEPGDPTRATAPEVLARGETIVREQCTTCHLYRGEGDDSGQELAPELAGYGSLAWTRAQIHNPATPATYREHALDESLEHAMPRFDTELSAEDIDLVARFTRARARGLRLPP